MTFSINTNRSSYLKKIFLWSSMSNIFLIRGFVFTFAIWILAIILYSINVPGVNGIDLCGEINKRETLGFQLRRISGEILSKKVIFHQDGSI